MAVRILADSTINITEMKGIDFVSVPLTISTDERSFVDDEELDLEEMLDYLATYKGRSFTACPSIDTWLARYEGADEIYVIVLSSNISGAYNAAMMAADMYLEKCPTAKIHVFDSLSAGPEVRLLADYIASKVKKGVSFEEIVPMAEEYLKHTRVFFALESFHNFAQNGRISKPVAAVAGALGIRVIATAAPEGVIDIVEKARGAKALARKYMDVLDAAGYLGDRLIIDHCYNPEMAEKLSAMIKDRYPEAQIVINTTKGLASYYAEKGGILLACECHKRYE
ncbi:MAG: DegV family protein [Lachnospiraceae bacterium]|nr:DegV family protein [Candidatus Equihabitans merdae]